MIPSDQNTFTDADFTEMLNEEIQYFAVPHLMRTHEEYLVKSIDYALDTDSEQRYQIPSRAVGNKLRDAALVTIDQAFPNRPIRYYELSRVSLEELSDFNDDYVADYTNSFYIEDNDLVLLDQQPFSSGTLRMFFYLKPGTLVDDAEAGVISGIDTTTGVITLTEFPSNFSTLPMMDFVQSKSPNNVYAFDKQPLSVDTATRTVTFDPEDLPSELSVGDYLNIAGETIVPQLPTELHAVLAQRVAVAALHALGDTEGAQMAETRLQMMERATNDLIDNRVEGAPQKIRNRNNTLTEATYGTGSSKRRGSF